MFRRELKGMHLFLALGEALAHLEYLVHAGRIERRTTDASRAIRRRQIAVSGWRLAVSQNASCLDASSAQRCDSELPLTARHR